MILIIWYCGKSTTVDAGKISVIDRERRQEGWKGGVGQWSYFVWYTDDVQTLTHLSKSHSMYNSNSEP
jgi:hypothetical protein